MSTSAFHRRGSRSQGELLDRVLERVERDLDGALGIAVTLHSKRDRMTVLANRGIEPGYLDAQMSGLGGPIVVAVEHQVPVLSLDVWSDDRWPAFTADAVCARSFGDSDRELRRARGAAAVPGFWGADETLVLSCLLSEPARATTITTLIGYEQLSTAALVTTAAAEDGREIADMLAVLQSRGAIEQAKGAIMGRLRCDAETAWATLRRASHESNVKLRTLAVALVEHIGGAAAEQPAAVAPIVPDERARKTARLLWAVLSHAPPLNSVD